MKKAKKALQASEQNGADEASSFKGAEKSVEETYKKVSQLEHVLLRPDTYVGSIEKQTEKLWVFDEGIGMVFRNVTFVPGLYKIFDEIIVNAADHKQRDKSMDTIKVSIDRENSLISVYNSGQGIPVDIHATEKIYVPELIFGHLLTSSNYDDSEKKVTGGRNGYGAKLANIFSTEFTVETADGSRGKRYKQVFRNNMTKKGDPVITACKATDNFTLIIFKPDLTRFGMDHLDEDIVSLMTKRVYDLAGTAGVKVFLNNERIQVKNFKEYVNLYFQGDKSDTPKFFDKPNDRWEVCISLSDGQFQQISFVNSINTSKGGTHVNHVTEQITSRLLELVNKKVKGVTLKPHQVKSYLAIFINCLIENPAFDSQTKENMTLKASAFGSSCPLSEEVLKKVMKSGIVDNILSFAKAKANSDLKKKDGSKKQRLLGIPKLEDANDAGGRNSDKCTLILTEGDSAKTLAVAGLSVVGRDHYGVFPLKGKVLNVREATAKQIAENAEIDSLRKILGLQHMKEYGETKSLRYGHLMIMTDQDHDGSHIKGLIINFIHSQWPSLLKVPGFLCEFITPIIKAKKDKKSIAFYTMPEYEAWRDSPASQGWSIKYYKGLGTSTAAEAKDYFSQLEKHRIFFKYQSTKDDEAIDLAFSKKKADDRKEWLNGYKAGTFVDHSCKQLIYEDFIHKELILFSIADTMRSIPSVVDGLKPGQRKILFSCFKRKLTSDIKVSQLSGYVSEHSAYHHGDASLASTIVNLAQDFVGSNNINLLFPSGQFGTRLQGGKDSASPRYIFTRLSVLTRRLFHEHDDKLLSYNEEDGQVIEPEWYIPVLPMVLVNGAEGIGTGWSTYVPNYNPRDIVVNLQRLLQGEDVLQMHPWWNGFKGSVTRNEKGTYTVTGIINKTSETTLEITELPVGTWTQTYKADFLEKAILGDEKHPPFIKDFKEYHTDTSVHFTVTMTEDQMQAAEAFGLVKKFKLSTSISATNMHLFTSEGKIKKYECPEDILKEFYGLRLHLYGKRKEWLLGKLRDEARKLSNKVRFILEVVRGQLIINNRKKDDLLKELVQRGYDPLDNSNKGSPSTEEDDEAQDPKSMKKNSFDYLLSMPLWSLTMERVQALCRQKDEKDKEIVALEATSIKDLWNLDLQTFLQELEELEKEQAVKASSSSLLKAKGGKAKVAKPKKLKAVVDGSESEDLDEESDAYSDFEEPKKVVPKKKKPDAPAEEPLSKKPPAAKKIPQKDKEAIKGAQLQKTKKDGSESEDMNENLEDSASDFEEPKKVPPKKKTADVASEDQGSKKSSAGTKNKKEKEPQNVDLSTLSLRERIALGSDSTVPVVGSVRTAMDSLRIVELSDSDEDVARKGAFGKTTKAGETSQDVLTKHDPKRKKKTNKAAEEDIVLAQSESKFAAKAPIIPKKSTMRKLQPKSAVSVSVSELEDSIPDPSSIQPSPAPKRRRLKKMSTLEQDESTGGAEASAKGPAKLQKDNTMEKVAKPSRAAATAPKKYLELSSESESQSDEESDFVLEDSDE